MARVKRQLVWVQLPNGAYLAELGTIKEGNCYVAFLGEDLEYAGATWIAESKLIRVDKAFQEVYSRCYENKRQMERR